MCYSTEFYRDRAFEDPSKAAGILKMFEQDRKFYVKDIADSEKYAERDEKKIASAKSKADKEMYVESAEMWREDAERSKKYVEGFDTAIAQIKEKYPHLAEDQAKKREQAAARKHERELKKAEAAIQDAKDTVEASKARHPSAQQEIVTPPKRSNRQKKVLVR